MGLNKLTDVETRGNRTLRRWAFRRPLGHTPAQLFFHEVRRYGTRGRPGGIHHLAGSIERRAGTPRARVAEEPLRARIGHPAAEQPLYRLSLIHI